MSPTFTYILFSIQNDFEEDARQQYNFSVNIYESEHGEAGSSPSGCLRLPLPR